MGVTYFGSKLSPHIIKTPAGFLICKDAAISRTGTQKYLAKEIGLENRGNDIVTVYRLEEDVFKPEAMASMAGAPLTLEHPSDWVNPQNASNLAKGTVTNIHRGSGKDSDLLFADIIVYDEQLINEIETKHRRELSVGYECSYIPYKDGYKQVDIVGNHVALVSAGRAGERVAIKDTAENTNKNISNNERSKRMAYRIPRKSSITDFVNAVGLKTLAADAEPEEVQEMVEGLVDEKKKAECDEEPIVIEPDTEGMATDEDVEELKNQMAEIKDSIQSILNGSAEDEDEEVEEEVDEDEGMESLDSFIEGEEEEVEDEDLLEQVEEASASPEEINEEVEDADEEEEVDEEETLTTDSIKELAAVLRPVVASITDTNKRKQVSDSLAEVFRKHRKQAKDASAKKSNYSKMLGKATDSAINEQEDLGMKIAKASNPHYKEVK